MRRSLVGFESPNFGHAFLDGFDDFERDEYTEDAGSGYSGDELPPSHTPRTYRGGDMTRSRTRMLAGSEGASARSHHPHSVANGLRDLSSSKWKDKHSPEVAEQCNKLLISEPEPSLDDRLVAPPPDWATCCVCHEIFKNPFSTMCGHSFCYDCIIEVIHRKGTCPLCRHPIGLNEITEDKQTSQAISGLTVRCKYALHLVSPPSLPIATSFSPSSSLSTMDSTLPMPFPPAPSPHYPNNTNVTTTSSSSAFSSSFSSPSSPSSSSSSSTLTTASQGGMSSPIAIRNSPSHPPLSHARSLPSALPSFFRTAAKWAPHPNACLATFTLAQQPTHEVDCPHRPVVCYHDGCNEKIKSKDLQAHMESCSRRVVQCHDCKEMFLLVDEKEHNLHCPEKEIDCPEKCNVKVRRKEQADHLSVCSNLKVTCAHAQYGCTYIGVRASYALHQAECEYKQIATVLGALAQQVSQLHLDNKNQAHTIATLQQELRMLQGQVREQAAEIRILREASPTRPSLFKRDTIFE
eukprot:Phypoly_transcript_01189.p1 GENE.Phypoly_transcript_01189~~Phypoly_transcript_01189.p1  ORF type:complete len:520 (+),score=57.02 Phypoly_transcript_01189:1800-3359(+)